MLKLTEEETIARARADLRIGVPVVFAPNEGGGVVAAAVEAVSADRLRALREIAPGALDVTVTARRADTIKARAYDGDIARIALAEDVSLPEVAVIADPAHALTRPLLGPFRTRRDGSATAHRMAIRMCKSAHLLPAAVTVAVDDPAGFAAASGLTLVDNAMTAAALAAAADMTHISSARVPLSVSDDARVHVWRPKSGEEEHYAIEIGAPDRSAPVLSRLHSACFTGDLIGSLKCDCGPQLRAALDQIGREGAGVLLYLNQEGRGIGLANKMRAYSLQDQGFDTVEANHRLGFEDDERDFRIGARILSNMGFSSVRLMTNNPGKTAAMETAGVHVAERVPLIVGETAHNVAYLATKAKKSGHLL
ncbi:MAG: GTP cyclohydrolase II [Pseudomonadota bacterium]